MITFEKSTDINKEHFRSRINFLSNHHQLCFRLFNSHTGDNSPSSNISMAFQDVTKIENPFAPGQGQGGRGKAPPVALSITEKTPYWVLPGSSSDETKISLLLHLAMAGTSESGKLSDWKTWVLTYLVGVAPHLSSKLPARAYPKNTYNDEQVKHLTDGLARIKGFYETKDMTVITSSMNDYVSKIQIPGLPQPNLGLEWSSLSGDWNPRVLLSHFSIVLFLAGKRVEGTDHSSITTARPEALRKKAHMLKPRALLDGPLRLSDTSHNLINNSWAEMSAARAAAIVEFSTYGQSDTDFGQDIIYTTMHLLRWSGLQHAKITMDFLHAYPWAPEVPTLRTFVAKYIESMKAAGKYEAGLQPYLKIIFQDKVDIFPRKELEPLVGCALEMMEYASDTLKDFYRSSEYSSIVAAFREEAERRATLRTQQLRAREVHLEELIGEEETEETPSQSS
jgi:hypothetical protein